MMNKEIEDLRKENNEEMEKEMENTRNIHLNEIEGKINLFIYFHFFLLLNRYEYR
jgi:hypothetical protein